METPNHVQHAVQATIKAGPAIVPGIVTVFADWLDLINTMASAAFMVVSLAFLLWRWRVAYVKEEKE